MSTLVDPSQPVDYGSNTVPSTYKCGGCGKTGVKLWRDYQTFLDRQSLMCADCSAKQQKKDITGMSKDGLYPSDMGPTDQIGWRIPAVPTAENDTFWGYTSVPEAGCAWWRRLPVR